MIFGDASLSLQISFRNATFLLHSLWNCNFKDIVKVEWYKSMDWRCFFLKAKRFLMTKCIYFLFAVAKCCISFYTCTPGTSQTSYGYYWYWYLHSNQNMTFPLDNHSIKMNSAGVMLVFESMYALLTSCTLNTWGVVWPTYTGTIVT